MFGSVYAGVAGMMTYVALVELLPSARRHDAADAVTTKALVLGFVLMTSTLVLLAYVDSGESEHHHG